MGAPLLACGPYFDYFGLGASILVLLIAKPITYYAFITAFRFRVNRWVPLGVDDAVYYAVIRAIIGLVVIGACAGVLVKLAGTDSLLQIGWVVLLAERIPIWWCLGKFGVKLAGRRLIGWTISGTAIDMVYDYAIATSLFVGPLAHVVLLAPVVVFIGALQIVGRRDALVRRFALDRCRSCGYDLRGNLSGICPECGTDIASTRPPA